MSAVATVSLEEDTQHLSLQRHVLQSAPCNAQIYSFPKLNLPHYCLFKLMVHNYLKTNKQKESLRLKMENATELAAVSWWQLLLSLSLTVNISWCHTLNSLYTHQKELLLPRITSPAFYIFVLASLAHWQLVMGIKYPEFQESPGFKHTLSISTIYQQLDVLVLLKVNFLSVQ